MSFGYCPKCKKNVGDRLLWDGEGIWRCSKCRTKLKAPRSDATASTQARVVKVLEEWKTFEFAFSKLPPKVRRELGELIEFGNTGEKPPGRCISDAFKEWLEGGRA